MPPAQPASRSTRASACCSMAKKRLTLRTLQESKSSRSHLTWKRNSHGLLRLEMNASVSEAALIADQLHRAFEGEAWHGPALLELLEDVDAATAAATPWPGVHSIWELVLHIAAWDGAALRRLKGETVQL